MKSAVDTDFSLASRIDNLEAPHTHQD